MTPHINLLSTTAGGKVDSAGTRCHGRVLAATSQVAISITVIFDNQTLAFAITAVAIAVVARVDADDGTSASAASAATSTGAAAAANSLITDASYI